MNPEMQETAIIPIIQEELETFDTEVERFRRGENDPVAFQQYRLREGVYGQRQPDSQMMRVKIPGGIVNARQLETLGEIAGRYTLLNKGHITTRENIQFHHMTLEDAAQIRWELSRVGMTTREACGNTVRNVVSCPLAGVCQDEVFDVTPYLTAYVRYFVRKPFTQNMPRKFKTSFSPCASDCATAPFHDLGFVAEIREIDGVARKGFRMHVGGGSAIMPRSAPALYQFVAVEDYLRVSEAILKVFNRSDELRKNRIMARIKVLVDRIGIDKFRELVEAELQQPWAKEPIKPEDYMVAINERALGPYKSDGSAPLPGQEAPAFLRWKATNTVPQKQEGYYGVYLKVPQGDLKSEQFAGLAKVSRNYSNGAARLSAEQNLALRWVREDKLAALWGELQKLGLGGSGVHEITDVTSCPGTDTCKLGITASMGANRALSKRLEEMEIEDPLVRAMHIKLSGCPNGCGRHHLASIGFQGAAVKGEEGHQVPAYEVYVGGRYQGGDFRYAKRVSTKIPAKRLPDAVEHLVKFYQSERKDGEGFDDFVDRVGHPAFEAALAGFRGAGPVAENMALYEDWERSGLYVLERGEGECAI